MSEFKKLMLAAPDTQIDECMKPLIEKWDDEPTAYQILEVLDNCIYAALSTGFVVTVLQIAFDEALKREGKTHEEVYAYAETRWRNRE